ncbi:MAG: MMPL family transporter [Acidobacteriota bacterium]
MAAGRTPWIFALLAALLVSWLAALSLSRLDIATGIVDLLPEGRSAADDYRTFLAEFGGLEQVFVIVTVDGADEELLVEAAVVLADELEATAAVDLAQGALSAEDLDLLRREILPRAPLTAPREVVAERLDPASIAPRIAELRRRLRSPAGSFAATLAVADPLGFATALLPSGPHLVDPVTGGFLSRDGGAALVIVTPAGGPDEGAVGRALLAALETARSATERGLGVEVALQAVGGPLYAAQDEALFRRNLGRTLGASGVGVALLLLLYFRGPSAPVAVLLSVAVGVLWTAGWAVLRGAPLSALSVSFAAILLGLGVDYGIHVTSRYRHLRLGGLDPGSAMLTAWRETGAAILTSALTTVGAFAALAQGHFPPVQELGFLVMAGIAAILAASMAVGGSFLVLTAGSRALGPEGALWRALGGLSVLAVTLGQRYRRSVVALAILASLASLAMIGNLRFSGDLRALRPADHPALAAEQALIAGFALGLDRSTAIVTAADFPAALALAGAVEEELISWGAEVTSPARGLAEVPGRRDQLAGEPAAAAARELRSALLSQGLAEAAFDRPLAVLDELAAGTGPPALEPAALPPTLQRQIRSEGDATRLAISFAMPLGAWPEGPPGEVLDRLEAIDPAIAVASIPRLGSEIKQLLADDLRTLGGWSLAVVVLCVLLSFRGRPRSTLLALVPVGCGVLWTLGLGAAFGLVIDPFSLLVAPLLLGIGIDDGLHAVHGRRRYGSLGDAVSVAGRAMCLTTFTTALGFGSLALSRVPALRNGGLLVAIGTLLCLLATLVLLPACERRE